MKNWKISGKTNKEYDNFIKGYIFTLPNAGTSKIQIPPNEKQDLGIVQGYIVFQIYLYSLKMLSIEIFVSDTTKKKRRLLFSSGSKDISINQMHTRIPLSNLPLNSWMNLSIDVISFSSDDFKDQIFRSIDYISISGNMKIRRIFSMKNRLNENLSLNGDENIKVIDILPKSVSFPINFPYLNYICSIFTVRQNLDDESKGKISQPQFQKDDSNINHNAVLNSNLKSPANKKLVNMSNLQDKIKLSQNKRLSTFINGKKLLGERKINDKLRSRSNNTNNIYNENLKPIETKSKSPSKLNENSRNSSLTKSGDVEIMVNGNNSIKKKELFVLNPSPKSIIIEDGNFNNSITKKNNYTFEMSEKFQQLSIEKRSKNNKYNINQIRKENSKNEDSIEELEDYEIKRTEEDQEVDDQIQASAGGLNKEELNVTTINNDSIKQIYYNDNSAINKYYDIPIKDKSPQITGFKESFYFSQKYMKEEEREKKNFALNELLNEEKEEAKIERPFTPPITKLVKLDNNKDDRVILDLNKIEENVFLNNYSESGDFSKIHTYNIENHNYVDLIYDPDLGLFYNPKTNKYYEK